MRSMVFGSRRDRNEVSVFVKSYERVVDCIGGTISVANTSRPAGASKDMCL